MRQNVALCANGLMPFPTLFPLYPGPVQYTRGCIASTPRNITSKQLAAFRSNHRRNSGQRREKNESCHTDYHQSSKKMAEMGIGLAASSHAHDRQSYIDG